MKAIRALAPLPAVSEYQISHLRFIFLNHDFWTLAACFQQDCTNYVLSSFQVLQDSFIPSAIGSAHCSERGGFCPNPKSEELQNLTGTRHFQRISSVAQSQILQSRLGASLCLCSCQLFSGLAQLTQQYMESGRRLKGVTGRNPYLPRFWTSMGSKACYYFGRCCLSNFCAPAACLILHLCRRHHHVSSLWFLQETFPWVP